MIDALPGIKAPNLTGGTSKMLPNHHITKPVFIGEIRADGQFDVVWKTKGLVPGDAWSDYLPGSKDLEADWVTLKCGNYNKVTKKCGGRPRKLPFDETGGGGPNRRLQPLRDCRGGMTMRGLHERIMAFVFAVGSLSRRRRRSPMPALTRTRWRASPPSDSATPSTPSTR